MPPAKCWQHTLPLYRKVLLLFTHPAMHLGFAKHIRISRISQYTTCHSDVCTNIHYSAWYHILLASSYFYLLAKGSLHIISRIPAWQHLKLLCKFELGQQISSSSVVSTNGAMKIEDKEWRQPDSMVSWF